MGMVIDLTNNEGEGQALKNDILKLLINGKLLLDENPKEALELFYQAETLYSWHSPDFYIACRFNNIFNECLDRELIPEA